MGLGRWAAVLGCTACAPLALGVLTLTLGGDGASGCATALVAASPAGSGSWLATAYGPPWRGDNGTGITATGLDLQAAPPAYEVAVDPALIALRSYVRVQPNPFGTSSAFYVGDTGSAIVGQHVDIYDWRGRAAQLAWGTRPARVTPAPTPGAGNLLGAVHPAPAGASAFAQGCFAGAVGLTAGETARIQPNGGALAPAVAPAPIRLAIAAGNRIHTLPYPSPDVHYGTLARLWPAYDCSGTTSFVLYSAGLLGPDALVSGQLASWGLPGPGRWITVYANDKHTWIVVAGIALDTAGYGGPAIPAGSGPRWRSDPLANLQDGSSYVARHPPGL
jgi:3D (Asp-Asp-Asp) domain-containing protein